jgi:polyferredoxin
MVTLQEVSPASRQADLPALAELSVLPRSRFARWRACTLALVYLLMVVHITHWMIVGRTLAPLELNEVMYTAELGIVTAEFIFMSIAVLATAVFGRFFCSWGCHILALQDLCTWILGKLHIRPKGIRSRAMLWIPVAAALYMFVWPQAVRVWEGRAPAKLHLRTDAGGWASLVTENSWRNLPDPAIIVLTFGICGFLIVYVLGSRGFCAYGCPYGAIFGLVDRMAPGRIRVGRGDCRQYGTCTAVCGSHVRVHEELGRYGMVVNPACLKDLDCVSACPQHAAYYGFGKPSVLKTVRNDITVRKQYDFTLREEAMMLVVFVATLLVFRGLYDRFPFLMTVGLGVVVGYCSVVVLRLSRKPNVKLNRWPLKTAGRLLHPGQAFVGLAAVFVLFSIHSAFVRYHTHEGRRSYYRMRSSEAVSESDALQAVNHFAFVERWGLLPVELNHRMLAETHYGLAGARFKQTRPRDAREHLLEAVRLWPNYAAAEYDLGGLLIEAGDLANGSNTSSGVW